MTTTRGAAVMALLLALLASPAAAQAVSPACGAPCPSTDLLCVARQHVCQSKLDVYAGYMQGLGQAVTMHALPPRYVELLRPLFPAADLAGYRFGFTERQPAGTALTDCDRTYFGDAEFVERLVAGELVEEAHFDWLLHELAHVQQCSQVGGRDHYARMWFGDLGMAALANPNPLTLHGRMRMEREAAEAARRALDALGRVP